MPVCMEGHEPGDPAPSMGWLLGKEKVCVAISCIASESRDKAQVLGTRLVHGSASRDRWCWSLLDHSPLMPPHSAL